MEQSEFPGEGIGYESGLRERSSHRARLPANVGNVERLASAIAGAALLYFGLRKIGLRKTYVARKRSPLGALMALAGANLLFRGALGKSLLYKAIGLSTAKQAAGEEWTIKVEKSVTLDRSPEEIYRFWRNFENLPRVMDHLKAVRSIDDRRSHWIAKGPAGMEVEWDAEIAEDAENRRIGWRSLAGSDIFTEGRVSFEPGPEGRGTVVHVSLEYLPPAGKAGAALARLFGADPNRQIADDLARFKQLLETGEIVNGQYARG